MSNLAEKIGAQSQWVVTRSGQGVSTHTFVRSARQPQSGSRNKVVREAVLAHIKALRKLGQTRVNTRDIASALNLPHALVEQAASQLASEGVKAAK
jgi:hypothetical protein